MRLRLFLIPPALASMAIFAIAVTQPYYGVGGGCGSGVALAASAAPAGGALSYAQLEGVWVQAGGPSSQAPVAAAVAMAESGGNAIMQQGQPYATTGWSYWQITPGNSEPQFGVDAQLFVPINGARAAVAKYRAAGNSFSPWTTYTSGSYLAYMHGGPSAASLPAAACSSIAGGGDPAPGARWGRLDMGFDGNYDMTKGAVAPYNGVAHVPHIGGWPGQGKYFYVVNADQTGPDYTRAMYFAEGAVPTVADGQQVVAGQPVGAPVLYGGCAGSCANPAGNFEIGPANTTNGDCLAKSYGLGSPAARSMVMSFYSWMRSLGAGASNDTSSAGNK